MGRPKGSRNRPKAIERIPKTMSQCVCCGQTKDKEMNFYKSYSVILQSNDYRMIICKDCVQKIYFDLVKKYNDAKLSLYYLCRLLDVYFNESVYESALTQANNQGSNVCVIYFQKVNSLPQCSKKTFFDSTNIDVDDKGNPVQKVSHYTEEDKQNKSDVIRMVGYDPFETENDHDKKYLYNLLVDYLDESTVEDSFKLPIVIEIVKTFNQINKINQALAMLTEDPTALSGQVGNLKSLTDAKQKLYNSILSMAKDNGISVNYNNNKSKGSGTLSGIIKKLQELDFKESDVNVFDIETEKGIRQVADVSNKSIIQQLMFDENDYTDMIAQQRDMIKELTDKCETLEEENRVLKINSTQS